MEQHCLDPDEIRVLLYAKCDDNVSNISDDGPELLNSDESENDVDMTENVPNLPSTSNMPSTSSSHTVPPHSIRSNLNVNRNNPNAVYDWQKWNNNHSLPKFPFTANVGYKPPTRDKKPESEFFQLFSQTSF